MCKICVNIYAKYSKKYTLLFGKKLLFVYNYTKHRGDMEKLLFNHIPVLLNECIEGLNIKSEGTYVDGTLGGAGHSSKILSAGAKRLIAIDKDDDALRVSKERLGEYKNVTFVKSDFKDFVNVLDGLGIDKVDGVLLDLGISSWQVDCGERGFSYRVDAPLDMRMDRTKSFSAYDVVNGYSEAELRRILFTYGEESWAPKIAQNIVASRPINTTLELRDVVEKSIPKKFWGAGSVAKKTFQAIRIEVNGELDGLDIVLRQMAERLNKGGRICVITFHSLEDRIVKNVFKELSTGCLCDKRVPICTCGHKALGHLVNRKPILPSDVECETNKRSTSAKLRIFERD